VAIKDGEKLRSGGRIKTSVAELELFAQSLAPDDQVALEASGPALAIKRVLEPHVGRVVVANTRKVRAIAEAKVKTDKVDAATLCELLHAGFLPSVFSPDEWTRSLRRRLQRRAKLVRARTRAKNELHAVLATVVACVDVLLDVGVKTFKALDPLIEVAPDGFTTPVSGSVWVFRLPLNLRIVELRGEHVEVASVERVVCSTHDLHVLLRHRPIPTARRLRGPRPSRGTRELR
jgi:hypothetical protein